MCVCLNMNLHTLFYLYFITVWCIVWSFIACVCIVFYVSKWETFAIHHNSNGTQVFIMFFSGFSFKKRKIFKF